MFAADSFPQLTLHLFATISKVIVPIFLAAILTIFLPVAFIVALGDFIWFRLRAVLRSPQPPKGLWEF